MPTSDIELGDDAAIPGLEDVVAVEGFSSAWATPARTKTTVRRPGPRIEKPKGRTREGSML